MEFMKNDKEERSKERERDKKELKELISQGVKEEVAAALKPLQERQRNLEGVQSDLTEEVRYIKDEFVLMKERVKEQQDFPALPQPHGQPVHQLEELR